MESTEGVYGRNSSLAHRPPGARTGERQVWEQTFQLRITLKPSYLLGPWSWSTAKDSGHSSLSRPSGVSGFGQTPSSTSPGGLGSLPTKYTRNEEAAWLYFPSGYFVLGEAEEVWSAIPNFIWIWLASGFLKDTYRSGLLASSPPEHRKSQLTVSRVPNSQSARIHHWVRVAKQTPLFFFLVLKTKECLLCSKQGVIHRKILPSSLGGLL